MVEKMVVKMSCFGGKEGRRWWCGGVDVVGMEEEMEERMVELWRWGGDGGWRGRPAKEARWLVGLLFVGWK